MPSRIHTIVVDASSINELDTTAVRMLARVSKHYMDRDVTVLFANWKGPQRDLLDRSGFYEFLPPEHLFLSLHDAVIFSTGSTTGGQSTMAGGFTGALSENAHGTSPTFGIPILIATPSNKTGRRRMLHQSSVEGPDALLHEVSIRIEKSDGKRRSSNDGKYSDPEEDFALSVVNVASSGVRGLESSPAAVNRHPSLSSKLYSPILGGSPGAPTRPRGLLPSSQCMMKRNSRIAAVLSGGAKQRTPRAAQSNTVQWDGLSAINTGSACPVVVTEIAGDGTEKMWGVYCHPHDGKRIVSNVIWDGL
eukprot:GHVL01040904.1.p2 GENE.GHVL01040904.1~~GHVL01040904.1.p2  ORF type:complete len:305 (+),score=44.76 GHVL01040904.1:1909-2823(+)